MGNILPFPSIPLERLSDPLPVSEFGNGALRRAVEDALAGLAPGHGDAFLEITNKGGGVMVAHKFSNLDGRGPEWAVVARARYNFGGGPEVAAVVRASW